MIQFVLGYGLPVGAKFLYFIEMAYPGGDSMMGEGIGAQLESVSIFCADLQKYSTFFMAIYC